MASGIIGDLKADRYDCPIETDFTQTFAASARTLTTATAAGYPAIPAGFYGVFAGFSTNASFLLFQLFNPNASGSQNFMATRNMSTSQQSNRPCNFYNSLIPTDLIDDERNL